MGLVNYCLDQEFKRLLVQMYIPVPGSGGFCSSESSAEVGVETGGSTASFEGVVPAVGMAINPFAGVVALLHRARRR